MANLEDVIAIDAGHVYSKPAAENRLSCPKDIPSKTESWLDHRPCAPQRAIRNLPFARREKAIRETCRLGGIVSFRIEGDHQPSQYLPRLHPGEPRAVI